MRRGPELAARGSLRSSLAQVLTAAEDGLHLPRSHQAKMMSALASQASCAASDHAAGFQHRLYDLGADLVLRKLQLAPVRLSFADAPEVSTKATPVARGPRRLCRWS